MSTWNDLIQWFYGNPETGEGFWYSQVLQSLSGLNDEELFWVPDCNSLCLLWHAGHITHREKTHIDHIICGRESDFIPERFEVFGTDWCSVSDLRKVVDSPEDVFRWVTDVRKESREFIVSLSEDDLHRQVAGHVEGLTVANWLLITASHCALHIGKIQVLRSMLEGRRDNPC